MSCLTTHKEVEELSHNAVSVILHLKTFNYLLLVAIRKIQPASKARQSLFSTCVRE